MATKPLTHLTKLTPSLPSVNVSQQANNPTTDQSPLSNDEDIWEKLLQSEASKQFLKEQSRKAEDLLNNEQK